MEKTEKQANTPIQAWTKRAEKKEIPPKIDYYSEITTWLLHAITEAEKNKNVNKKDQLLTFQKGL